MYLSIKAYSKEAFNKFHNIYSDNTTGKDNIIFDQIMVGGVQITFYHNLTILFKGQINESIHKNIDILIDKNLFIGSDEVGIGEGVGPIVVAAIKFPNFEAKKRAVMAGIKDSKKMNHNDILRVAKTIKTEAKCFVKRLVPLEFNKLYKTHPNMKAINAFMQNDLLGKFDESTTRVTDQFVNLKKFNEYLVKFRVKKFDAPFILETKAEERYVEVAAAAIIAKAEYNTWMINYCKEHNLPLTIGERVQAQKLYLDYKDGKFKLDNPDELVKDWSKEK